MLENLTRKQKTIFAIIIIFMVIIIIYYIYSTLASIDYDSDSIEDNSISDTIDSEAENVAISENVTETNEILVHVSGCVKENKVVSLPDGSRINDAIEAAGGLTKDADLSNVNLAYILEDGEKIYIPKKGEQLSEFSSASIADNSSSISNNTSLKKTTKININKATQAELETIPGIGPSTALKIVTYRNENGKFKSIEDIKNVSGIGDAKYEKMKDYITIK